MENILHYGWMGHGLEVKLILYYRYKNPIKFIFYWISVDEFLYQNQWGGISLLNTVNLSEKVLMSNTTFVSILKRFWIVKLFYWFFFFIFMLQLTFSPYKFSISADRKYLLLAQNVQKLFRHSYLAQYTIYDITTRYI